MTATREVFSAKSVAIDVWVAAPPAPSQLIEQMKRRVHELKADRRLLEETIQELLEAIRALEKWEHHGQHNAIYTKVIYVPWTDGDPTCTGR